MTISHSWILFEKNCLDSAGKRTDGFAFRSCLAARVQTRQWVIRVTERYTPAEIRHAGGTNTR